MDIRSFFSAKPNRKQNVGNNNVQSNNNDNSDKIKISIEREEPKNDRKKNIENEKEATKKKITPVKGKERIPSKSDAKPTTPIKDSNEASSSAKTEYKSPSSNKKDKHKWKKDKKTYDDDAVEIESDNSNFDSKSIKEKTTDKTICSKNDNMISVKGKKVIRLSDDEDESPVKAKRKKKVTDKKKRVFSSEEDMEIEEYSDRPKKKSDRERKTGAVIFDSDSEPEEHLPKSNKKKKRKSLLSESDHEQASIEDAFSKMQPKKPLHNTVAEVIKQPSPAKKKMSATDFFGVETVKRVESRPSVKRKAKDDESDEDFEYHDDEEFVKTLAHLDTKQQATKKLKREITSPVKESALSTVEKKKILPKVKEETRQPSKDAIKLQPNEATGRSKVTKVESPKKQTMPEKEKKNSPVKSPTKIPTENTSEERKLCSDETSPSSKPDFQRKGSGFRNYLHREGPQALGSKEIPKGGENCLEGLAFVITGILESIERDEAKTLVEKYGGKVTGSLSKKTSYIVVGRDAGESKMAKAHQFGTKLLDEDGLLDLIRTLPGKKSKYLVEAEKTAMNKIKSDFSQKLSNFECTPETKRNLHTSSTTRTSVITSPTLSAEPTVSCDSVPTHTLMWVDKYKPNTMKQIIGQQGDKSNARKLLKWLHSWHSNRTLNKKPAFNRFNDDGSGYRAALLSGPPGVGKTTTATIVCKQAEFSFIELNASDTRSKKSLQTEVAEALGNHTLLDFFGNKSAVEACVIDGKKHCLLMDEVDGMAGNEDRGGMQELIQLIKTSKIPIICMCNDRNHQKVRSLANYCFDLRFQRPRLEQIKSAMMSVVFKEGLKIPPPALNEIIAAANQDIRQVLHNLSMWTAKEKNVSYEQVKKDAANAKKDLKLGPFDVCRKVFVGGEETRGMTMNDKSNLFFHDYSFGPLFVQENYINVTPFAAKGSMTKSLELLSRTADSLTDSDLVDRHIRGGQNWSLLPLQAMYASVIPGDTMRGSMGGMVQFPQWLGKNSTTNKNQRLLQELKSHMRLKIFADKNGLNMEYFPHLRCSLTSPLVEQGNNGVPQVVQLLDDYDLLREDFDSILDVTAWPGSKDPMSQVETKTKAAFTRAYNKEVHLTPYSTVTTCKKNKRMMATGTEDLALEGEEGAVRDESEEERDDVLSDGMVKAKKPVAKKVNVKKTGDSKKGASSATKGKGRAKKK